MNFRSLNAAGVSLIAIVIGGCATIQVSEPNPIAERLGQEPKIGTKATTPVGGIVFSQYRFVGKTAYRVFDPISLGFMLGRVSVNAGDPLLKASFDGRSGYCTERLTYIDPLVGPLKPSCYVEGADGKLTAVHVAPGAVWFEKALPFPVRFEKAEIPLPGSNSFKNELLYQGISNKTLRLSYREYSNDMARPAYFQDVSYEIPSLPTTISFKNVRLEVLEAGNAGLTYRVLSSF